MHIQHNYLRKCRKQAYLSQKDMAMLLGLKDYTKILRWEHGTRLPDAGAIICYQLIFDRPIHTFYEAQTTQLIKLLIERIKIRIANISEQSSTFKQQKRIETLQGILARLSTLNQPTA